MRRRMMPRSLVQPGEAAAGASCLTQLLVHVSRRTHILEKDWDEISNPYCLGDRKKSCLPLELISGLCFHRENQERTFCRFYFCRGRLDPTV